MRVVSFYIPCSVFELFLKFVVLFSCCCVCGRVLGISAFLSGMTPEEFGYNEALKNELRSIYSIFMEGENCTGEYSPSSRFQLFTRVNWMLQDNINCWINYICLFVT